MKKQKGFTLIELLIVVAIIGIIAAIAIPSLLRARVSANESATLGDIRTLVSAQAAYHAANGGFYGPTVCLVAPFSPNCILSYPSTGPIFLDSQLGSLTAKSGYNRSFQPGDPDRRSAGHAVLRVPRHATIVGQTGVRGFGADCSGVVCFTHTTVTRLLRNGILSACSALR